MKTLVKYIIGHYRISNPELKWYKLIDDDIQMIDSEQAVAEVNEMLQKNDVVIPNIREFMERECLEAYSDIPDDRDYSNVVIPAQTDADKKQFLALWK